MTCCFNNSQTKPQNNTRECEQQPENFQTLSSSEVNKMEITASEKKQQKWTLEPALLLLFFGWYLSISIVTNQMLKQTCLFKFEYSFVICTQLDDKNTTGSVEQEIQPYVANILMMISVLNSIIPTILSLLLGPWSDKYGRKKVINCIFIGFTTSMGWITLVSYFSEYVATNNPWNYLLAQLPSMLFGGYPTLIVLILCYISDQTDESNRSVRFTIVEIIVFIGVLVAFACSSFLLELTNATTVFCISFACIFSAAIIAVCFVEETTKVDDVASFKTQIKDLFSPVRIKELYTTCVQPRPFKQRGTLFLLTIILTLTSFSTHGTNTVFYLFVRQRFGWTLQDMTLFEAASMSLMIFGSILGLIVLKKWLKFSDLSLSMVALASLTVDALIKTFATQSWQLYLASAVALFKLISGPMLRSIMSTIVTKHEISRIYSITSSVEAISGLAAAPVYAATYSATLSSFPAAFNFITAAVFAFTLILAMLISRWLRSSKACDTQL